MQKGTSQNRVVTLHHWTRPKVGTSKKLKRLVDIEREIQIVGANLPKFWVLKRYQQCITAAEVNIEARRDARRSHINQKELPLSLKLKEVQVILL